MRVHIMHHPGLRQSPTLAGSSFISIALADANRYTRHRQSTPGRRPPSLGGGDSIASSLAVSPAARDPAESSNAAGSSDALAASSGDAFAKEEPAFSGRSATAREERGGRVVAATAGVSLPGVGGENGATGGNRVPAATEFAMAAELGEEKEDAAVDGNGVAEAVTGGTADAGAADDVADAIARATAGFAMPAPSKAQAGEERDNGFAKPKPRVTSGVKGDAVTGREGGDRKTLGRPRSGGVSSNLMRGTASSASRLKLNPPSALEESRSGSAPRSSSRRPSTGESRLVALL